MIHNEHYRSFHAASDYRETRPLPEGLAPLHAVFRSRGLGRLGANIVLRQAPGRHVPRDH
jgi:hypothetical protein